MSLDVLRGEVESMGKAHQGIAAQMKTELEEPLTAFAGGMKERRKIVQAGIEKLYKIKQQQTQSVNKVRHDTRNKSGSLEAVADCVVVARSIRTRLSENQRLPCARSHGHGTRRAQEQGQDGKDSDSTGFNQQ